MTDRGETHGVVVVISGPSGSGKTTLVGRILKQDPELAWSVSATTRAPRAGEVDGRDYYFLTRDAFEKGIAEGTFAEWAESYGHLYGTPAAALEEALSAGRVIVLDIDVQGARQVRERFSDAVLIFIRPPDMTTLTDRLRRRRTESEEQFRVRLERARAELASASMYHHVIVNDDLERAVCELRDLIRKIKETRRG